MLNADEKTAVSRGFRLSRQARDLYTLDDALFTEHGNVTFRNFLAARRCAQQLNAPRDLISHPERAIKAGQLNALELIDEVMRYVVAEYVRQRNPEWAQKTLAYLDDRIGADVVDETLRQFTYDFPPQRVYTGEMSSTAFLAGDIDGVPNRQTMLLELVMVWLDNMNPACKPYRDLFDDQELVKVTAYQAVIDNLHEFLSTQPPFGPFQQQLIDMLRSPAKASPQSLSGQLEYILANWGYLLGAFLFRLLGSLDFIKEEEKAIFAGPGPAEVLEYDFSELDNLEAERFSEDKDWMPKLVLLAKNAYVWLDQLSKRYERAITRLDQIPDEELDLLARRGFSGLWLIGLWERSQASRDIKQRMGNPEAVASAYSLFAYDPANDLGGQEALENLRGRAWQRGMRLASDMVPNHMGIDSPWVIEHPDWFVSLDYSPFPSYSFNGPNLSRNDRVGIYLEDHYYNHSDAAVVFKRVDHWTGSETYIYHGNDGTSMPWNDTAQLNYLNAEVREAVIQTILHVARNFPVIRFDAAMTLAKKHYQRLWFPEPGTGGAIPSRAEHGMTRAQFNAAFPEEFWREVVDRVAAEAPDTLLLAEAFWLMEGYFVRTLGMHRVYNSAFMNMLRDEDNAKYRSVIKNTLEFDPQILKRFVNFMNNPDERTAVDQFGKGDKYFGVCVLMSTLPGLPMFGHGQVEGFSEKYGMEYRRAYWDETPDQGLIARHEREIFPLLHRRRVFAEVTHFLLYDLYTPDGHVNEDVFAYSNRLGHERGLIIYHNKFAETRGWIRVSAAALEKPLQGERKLVQRDLGYGLDLHYEEGVYTIFRDLATGLEYLRPSKVFFEMGLYVELHAYQYHIFVDFREARENEWGHYGQLHGELNGRGVPSVDEAVREIGLRYLHHPFRALVNGDNFRRLLDAQATEQHPETDGAVLQETEAGVRALLQAITQSPGDDQQANIAREVRQQLSTILTLPVIAPRFEEDGAFDPGDDFADWGMLFSWAFVYRLGKLTEERDWVERSRSLIDEWLLGKRIVDGLRELGLDDYEANRGLGIVKILVSEYHWSAPIAAGKTTLAEVLTRWLQDPDIQQLLGVNRYEGALWFNQDGFREFLWWMHLLALLADPENSTGEFSAARDSLKTLSLAETESAFQVEGLMKAVKARA